MRPAVSFQKAPNEEADDDVPSDQSGQPRDEEKGDQFVGSLDSVQCLIDRSRDCAQVELRGRRLRNLYETLPQASPIIRAIFSVLLFG